MPQLPHDLTTLVANFRAPATLGFGRVMAPLMYRADYRQGAWQRGELQPFAEIALNPAATALQFAQQAFEGMKAYSVAHAAPMLFRPDMNFRRLAGSARRLGMPAVDAEIFGNALAQLVGALAPIIPANSGQSLYLRPTLLGTDPAFAVQSSENFSFLLLASPSEAYYSKPIKVMIEREQCRAALGGTGADKVGGNYAASLQATARSIAAGFDQPLWLDPLARQNIEELSGMNLVALIDGSLHTPALNGSILPGVTRDSLLKLVGGLGFDICERVMPVGELLDDINTGRCSELFACGTAAVISPIEVLGEADGSSVALPQVNQVAARLRAALLNIQEGRSADSHGWMVPAAEAPQHLN